MTGGQPRPVFVYGTLRPGAVNWSQLERHAVGHRPARLSGFRLHELEYPCIVRAPTGEEATVLGDLVWLREGGHGEALATLDWFEGFDPDDPDGSLYVRAVAAVEVDDGDLIEAWVYLAGPSLRRRLSPANEVPGGEWVG